jgi:hypothetical protein
MMHAINMSETPGSRPAEIPVRLVKAAHEFEAQLMKELLNPMWKGDALAEDDESGGGILGEFAAEALGRSLSEHGGLGISDRILQSLSQTGNNTDALPHSGIRPDRPIS